MMSKKQWFVLFCIYMVYVLFGASVFYTVEHKKEKERLLEERNERITIESKHFIIFLGLILRNYVSTEEHTRDQIFYKISNYCGKPLGGASPFKTTLTWTYYHSVFFVMTIISTIGYGNLAPTTPFTRTFMILYGLVGIPINGILIITLGDFFGKTFFKLHKRWKNSSIQKFLATLGLIGESALYLIPGFAIFIVIPSIIIVFYEDWSYDLAIEFAFATLTTVGVGSIIPGTQQKDHSDILFALYKIFLLLWIVSGLGYLAMVFGFISRALRSKHMHNIERKIAQNIKKTNRKIRREIRSILNEYLLMKVDRVYRERRTCTYSKFTRTQSCPELRTYQSLESPKMKRKAVSECVKQPYKPISRTQSDTNLDCIDRDLTFSSETDYESNQFLQKVARALGHYENIYLNQAEEFEPDRSKMRPRSATDSRKDRPKLNHHQNWFEFSNKSKLAQESLERKKYGKARSRTLPPIQQPSSFLTRLKNTFRHKNSEDRTNIIDIESQSSVSTETEFNKKLSSYSIPAKDQLLEETSLADFLRMLTSFNRPTRPKPHRKFGTAQAPRTRRDPIKIIGPVNRKISLIPDSPRPEHVKQRKFSLSLQPTLLTSEELNALGEYKYNHDTSVSSKNRKNSLKVNSSSNLRPKRISWQNFDLKSVGDKNKHV